MDKILIIGAREHNLIIIGVRHMSDTVKYE